MKENFNPGLKESNNLKKKKQKTLLKKKKRQWINQHKQKTAGLDYRFFSYWKDYTIRMSQAIEKLKIHVGVK